MNPIDRIPAHTSPFDSIRRVDDDGSEWWSARDLMPLLGYGADWRNFDDAIDRAHCSAENTGHDVTGLFVAVTEKSGGRPRGDYRLVRFAAYLVAMNADPRKSKVAEAQTYFAVRTRQAELAQQHEIPQTLADALEFAARKVRALEASEKRNAELAPMAAEAEHHRAASGLKAVGDFANDLKAWAKTHHPDVKVRHQDVWDHLARLGLVIRGDTIRHNQPTAKAVDNGYCVPKVSDFDRPEGPGTSTTTRLTPKGEGFVWDKLTAFIEVNGTLELPRRIGGAA